MKTINEADNIEDSEISIKINEDPNSTKEDLMALKSNYELALEELGRNNYTMDLMRGYAELMAFQFNNPEIAKKELENALNYKKNH